MISYRLHALAMALVVLQAATVHADDATLQQGLQALKSGNAKQAIKLFSAELAAPNRTPEQRAKAFYLRAKAHYAAKQPALAMNDAASALWFNKLAPTDAADAATIRGQALAEAMTSAARVPAQTPVMPAIEKTPALAATPAPTTQRPAAAAAEQPPQPAPERHEPEIARTPSTQPSAPPFTTTTAEQPEASVVTTTAAPEPGPAAPDWAQANVKREQLATVKVPPEQRPARAVPAPVNLPPPPPVVTGSIEKTAPQSADRQESEAAPAQPLPWQTAPVRAASVEPPRKEAEAQTETETEIETVTATPPNIVTGSITRVPPAAPAPAPAAPETPAPPQASTPAVVPAEATTPESATAPIETPASSPSLSVQGFASMFASDNPMAADVSRADELQRARYERIRQMNAARNTGNQ